LTTKIWKVGIPPLHGRMIELKVHFAGVSTLYQERAVYSKMKMDPAKRAQTQNAGEVSSLQRFFSQFVELMMGKVWPDLLLAKYFYN
jgi:hypothetical protein